MKTITKHSIISCIYHSELYIVEITGIRNLSKEPLEQIDKSEGYFDGLAREKAKFIYTAIRYEDGSVCTFYDAGMSEVIVLSGKDFTVGKLKERFDRFRKEHAAEQERVQKEKEQESAIQAIPVSGLTPKEDAERLLVEDIRENARVEVVFYEFDTEGKHKSKYARFSGCNLEEGVVILYHPGINTFSKVPMNRIKSIYVLDEDGIKTPPSPYDGLTMNPLFNIPDYEIQGGYSEEFWNALNGFLDTTADALETVGPPKVYRFVLQGGLGHFDKHVCDYKRVQDGRDIEVTLCTNGVNTKPFSIGQFCDIILLS